MRKYVFASGFVALVSLTAVHASAQPAGWSRTTGARVTEGSGQALTDHQIALTIDTATPIGAGQMNADGSDIRVYADCAYTQALPFWIESGTINTANTKIWVRVPSLAANATTQLHIAYGNAAATSASDAFAVFDGQGGVPGTPFSSTDQVASGGAGGVTSSQRGFRFAPNRDVLVVQLGKREPNGSTRYVTIFDFATQAIVHQGQVSGAAAQYSYANVASPFWLASGTQYLLELYQGATDGYYFGTSTQINQHLTYFDMRYCNGCTQNTFPTNVLAGYHYGYPDFGFLIRKTATPEPAQVAVGCVASATCDADCSAAACGDGVTNALANEECDDGNNDDTDACRNNCKNAVCGDGVVRAGVEECDDGNNVDTDACRNNCKSAVCGDGVVRAGVDACDDGNNVDTDACRNNCAVATCGDGVVQAGAEQCDDGNNVDTDVCRNNCMNAICGDGVVRAGVEECDDGNAVDTDACRNNCKPAACGDGVVQAGVEQCDDGNTVNGDGCSSTCKTEPSKDAGTDAGSSGGSDAGARPDAATPTSDAGDAGAPAGEDPTTEDGCSCRMTGGGSLWAPALLVVALGATVARRRRRVGR